MKTRIYNPICVYILYENNSEKEEDKVRQSVVVVKRVDAADEDSRVGGSGLSRVLLGPVRWNFDSFDPPGAPKPNDIYVCLKTLTNRRRIVIVALSSTHISDAAVANSFNIFLSSSSTLIYVHTTYICI
jgi:hypothetical protein